MNVTDAAYATVHDYPGGSESLAPRLGMSPAVLRGKVNPNNDRNVLSLAEADALMGVSGDFRILHAMAAGHGFGLTPLDGADAGNLVVALLRAASAKGDLATVITEALADHVLTPNEDARIQRACAALQAAVIEIARCSAQSAKAPQA
jgi:hypothetical protein